MSTLQVQPAGRALFHCYAAGTRFSNLVAAQVIPVPGVKDSHLVTAGRDRWCLVLETFEPHEEDHAQSQLRLVEAVAKRLGFSSVEVLRHVERSEGGRATDIYDWLKR